MEEGKDLQLVIITGMSGAGKTVAIQSLEDLGFFCIDNLPPMLMPKFLELMRDSRTKMNNVALVIDLRGREFFDQLFRVLDDLEDTPWLEPFILFLDADDEVLVRRYKETRRSHPLAKSGLPLEGIKLERKLLGEIKSRAHAIIDTTHLKPKELREKIITEFSSSKSSLFTVNIVSFGFKHGIPIDADLVFDVRFLPNPYYIDELRHETGLNPDVYEYVMKWSDTQRFLEKTLDLLKFMLPLYKREGKTQLVIGIGCTGGQHRSIALAEYFKKKLQEGLAKTQVSAKP